jgi:hypothetical protein
MVHTPMTMDSTSDMRGENAKGVALLCNTITHATDQETGERFAPCMDNVYAQFVQLTSGYLQSMRSLQQRQKQQALPPRRLRLAVGRPWPVPGQPSHFARTRFVNIILRIGVPLSARTRGLLRVALLLDGSVRSITATARSGRVILLLLLKFEPLQAAPLMHTRSICRLLETRCLRSNPHHALRDLATTHAVGERQGMLL